MEKMTIFSLLKKKSYKREITIINYVKEIYSRYKTWQQSIVILGQQETND